MTAMNDAIPTRCVPTIEATDLGDEDFSDDYPTLADIEYAAQLRCWSPTEYFPCLSSPVPSGRSTPNIAADDEVTEPTASGDLYPNCDISIWLRSCREEVLDPLDGEITGCVPQWLTGSLLRNGPGSLEVGDMTYDHLFDSSALLHRFAISEGRVTYQNRFLRSETYKRNQAAKRIVVTEFGTRAVPDPCQSIFKRISSVFRPGETMSDNAMISVYPFGDEFYTFTESPVIHRIDPATLETLGRVDVSTHVAVVNHTSHPHVMSDGTVYNMGMTVSPTGPRYAIVCFPPDTDSDGSTFERATIVGSVRARWPLHPSYMHTFGITENFFVIVEQPLTVSVARMVTGRLNNEPTAAALKWFSDQPTLIHLVRRSDGVVQTTCRTTPFFFLHIINQYEHDDHVIIDICCYDDADMLDCMYIASLKKAQQNPDYARMFRGRPLRFTLPLSGPCTKGLIEPTLLCDMGCETPRINYDRHLGRVYRYFYAISSDVDIDNPGTLIKVDILTSTKKTWGEPNVYPSEPIFVQAPDPKSEDDGLVLSSLVWGQGVTNRAGLLILDAITWTEVARATFTTPSEVPKCLHGWFTSNVH